MTKNLTLKVDAELLKRARHCAVDRQQSLSAWVSNLIAQTIHEQDRYELARTEALNILQTGFELKGEVLTRDQLHER